MHALGSRAVSGGAACAACRRPYRLRSHRLVILRPAPFVGRRACPELAEGTFATCCRCGAAGKLPRSFASLRACDFFEVARNRCSKQNSYDDKIVENSKKSQTLKMTSRVSGELHDQAFIILIHKINSYPTGKRQCPSLHQKTF